MRKRRKSSAMEWQDVLPFFILFFGLAFITLFPIVFFTPLFGLRVILIEAAVILIFVAALWYMLKYRMMGNGPGPGG